VNSVVLQIDLCTANKHQGNPSPTSRDLSGFADNPMNYKEKLMIAQNMSIPFHTYSCNEGELKAFFSPKLSTSLCEALFRDLQVSDLARKPRKHFKLQIGALRFVGGV
jgi:hypothetical protein